MFHKHRVNKISGGVGLYLSDCFTSKIRTNLIFDDDDVVESLFIEVYIPHGKNIIIGIIYRPPNQNANSFRRKYNDTRNTCLQQPLAVISKHCFNTMFQHEVF